MDKLLFVTRYYLDRKFSLRPKFDNQMVALKNLGFDVWFIGCDDKGIYLINDENKINLLNISGMKIAKYKNSILHIRICQAAKKAIGLQDFKYVYMRSMFATPSCISMAKEIKRKKSKLIVEIPTHPIKREYSKETRKLRKIVFSINYKLEPFFDKYVDLFAVIGDKVDGSYHNRRAINIVNGFNYKTVPMRKLVKEQETINIIGLAHMTKWHGYDRVIKGISDYLSNSNNKTKVRFYLVGPDGDGSLGKWKDITKKLNLEDYIFFEGPKYGEDLNNYFDLCHIAVGSIGLHRTGFKSAATLKAREYMARGIPFVIATEDQALDSTNEYFYRIPDNENPANITKIIEFAKKVSKIDCISENMRKYAEKEMSWEKQFEKVFSVLTERKPYA